MEWSGQKTNLSLTFIKRYDRAGHRDKIPVKDLALLASLTRDTKYNYSIIRSGEKTGLSPAYDLLNTTIVLRGGAEEIALRLAGKKRNLNRKDLIDYFGKERCGLTGKVINSLSLRELGSKGLSIVGIRQSIITICLNVTTDGYYYFAELSFFARS